MELSEYFPIWNRLTREQQDILSRTAVLHKAKKGTLLHDGTSDCLGLLLIRSGQIRAYILSEEGREITIYRLFERDICLLTASCMMQNLQFDVSIEAEKDSSSGSSHRKYIKI